MHRVNILYEKIRNNIPFCFIKINDGECSIIDNPDEKVIASRGDQHSSELLSSKLKESLNYSHENYFVGLPCTKCHNFNMSKYVGENFLNANILINSNTNHTIELLSKHLENKYVVVITNKKLIDNIFNLQMLGIAVNKTIEVSAQNAFDNDYEKIKDMWKEIPDYAYVICLCGPLGRVICHEWFKNNNNLFCLELGSLFDPLLKNRSYSYHQNTLRLCTECNPKKLDHVAFAEQIPNYELLETECFYFNDLKGYLNFYDGDLDQIYDVLYFRSCKNDSRALQLLDELDRYNNAYRKINITINANDFETVVFYGTDSKNTNITDQFNLSFRKGNLITILEGTNFNSIFGDPCPGLVKKIFLMINGKEFIIDENYSFGILEIELEPGNNGILVSCESDDVKIDFGNYFSEYDNIQISDIKPFENTEKSPEILMVNYGSDVIRKDVTKKFVDKFVRDGKIVIGREESFNNYFGDICPGIIKNMIIGTSRANITIKEIRMNNIELLI